MRFTIDQLSGALEAIEYFNAFHDGFIQELTVRSHHTFPQVGEQQSLGPFDLDLLIAHYNYDEGRRPHDQVIRAHFDGVRDVAASFSGSGFEWSIDGVEAVDAQRQADDRQTESCLRFTITQKRLVEPSRWVAHEDLAFTFRSAVFDELEPETRAHDRRPPRR